jgi:hypothetical protein
MTLQRGGPLGLPNDLVDRAAAAAARAGTIGPARPVNQPQFVMASGLAVGAVSLSSPNGDVPALALQFTTPQGQLPPVMLVAEDGLDVDVLCDGIRSAVEQARAQASLANLEAGLVDEDGVPAPDPTCRVCGTRIFGEVAERGVCLSCDG